MQPCKRFGQPLIVTSGICSKYHRKTATTRRPSKASLYYPSFRQNNKTLFRLGMFNNLQLNAVCCRLCLCRLSCVALIGISQLHILTCNLLNRLTLLAYLRPFLLVCRRYNKGKQVTKRIYRQMNLATFTTLITVKTRPVSTFCRRLYRPTIENHCCWLCLLARTFPRQNTQVMHQRLEATPLYPSLRLLIHGFPTREIVWQHSPECTRTNNRVPAKRVAEH